MIVPLTHLCSRLHFYFIYASMRAAVGAVNTKEKIKTKTKVNTKTKMLRKMLNYWRFHNLFDRWEAGNSGKDQFFIFSTFFDRFHSFSHCFHFLHSNWRILFFLIYSSRCDMIPRPVVSTTNSLDDLHVIQPKFCNNYAKKSWTLSFTSIIVCVILLYRALVNRTYIKTCFSNFLRNKRSQD